MDNLAIMTSKMINYHFIFAVLFIFSPVYVFILHKTIKEYRIENYSKVLDNELTHKIQFKIERRASLISILLLALYFLVLLKNIFEWIITS